MFRYGERKVTKESDVFSYGVVIVQLVTIWDPELDLGVPSESGRRIWHWRHNCLMSSDRPMDAVDPALWGSGYESEILLAMKVAMLCTNEDPELRPTSSEALEMLLQIRNPDTVPVNDDVPTADSDRFPGTDSVNISTGTFRPSGVGY
jgi:serine/threonine protein kinase